MSATPIEVMLAIKLPDIKPEGVGLMISHDNFTVRLELLGNWLTMDLALAEAAERAIHQAIEEIKAKPKRGKEN